MRHFKTFVLSLVFITVATRLSAQDWQVRYNPLLQAESSSMALLHVTDSVMMSLASRFEPYIATHEWRQYVIGARLPWMMVTHHEAGPRLSDLTPFKCGPYWVPDPPPLFNTDYEYMSWQEALINTFLDILFF